MWRSPWSSWGWAPARCATALDLEEGLAYLDGIRDRGRSWRPVGGRDADDRRGRAATRDYRVAFLRYLPRREEAALHRGYELGRAAVGDGVSLLELAQVHHEVLLEAMGQTPVEDQPEVGRAAAEFFLEVLATFELSQQAFHHGRTPPHPGPVPRPGSGVTAPRPGAGVIGAGAPANLRPARA